MPSTPLKSLPPRQLVLVAIIALVAAGAIVANGLIGRSRNQQELVQWTNAQAVPTVTLAKLARGRMSALLFVVCLIPFWVSETVRTLGWMILLRESGVLPAVLTHLGITAQPVELLYHDATILVGLVYTSLLFMVVPLVGSLESLDNSLIEAAYDLGGKGWSILRTIVIPHAAPGITAGCIVVFMLTLGNYLTPTLLGGKNSLWFTEQIYTQFITRFNWEQGAALGFLLLALSTAMVWLGLTLSGQRFSDVMRRV